MKKLITNNAFVYTAGLIFVFLLWALISATRGEGSFVFPSPLATFEFAFKLLQEPYFYQSMGMTLLRTLEGFFYAFVLAGFFGSLAGAIKPLQRFFKPTILVLKSAPTAAFVFAFMIISGSTRAPIWIVGLLAFPILYESFVAGINAIPQEIRWAVRMDQASFASSLFKVKIPLALPYVALGVLSSFALSFKTTIMAEIVIGTTDPGLGGYIRIFKNDNPTDLTPIFAIALLAIMLILIVDLATYFIQKAYKAK